MRPEQPAQPKDRASTWLILAQPLILYHIHSTYGITESAEPHALIARHGLAGLGPQFDRQRLLVFVSRDRDAGDGWIGRSNIGMRMQRWRPALVRTIANDAVEMFVKIF